MQKYSVLMSVYNKENADYFRTAVGSMLNQTIPPSEFVLVCDGPLTEQLECVIHDVCMEHPEMFNVVRLEKNMGLGIALNIGLNHCTHELVARMDSDDISVSTRMEMQLSELERHPEICVVGGQIAEFWEDPDQITGYRKVPSSSEEILKHIKHRNPMNHVTVVMRKTAVMEAGGYQNVPGFEDYYLWSILTAKGMKMRNLTEVCCKVRANAGMFSRRGGWDYFMNTLKVERYLRDSGIISNVQFYENAVIRFVGTVLVSSSLRRIMYLKLLRKKKLDNLELEEKQLSERL